MAGFAIEHDIKELYEELGKADSKKDKLFDSMRDVYMLAFLLGVRKDERKKINKKASDPIREDTFGEENRIIMDFMALEKTKDINILRKREENDDYIHNLVEEYANGGIHILYDLLGKSHDLDTLISIVKTYEDDNENIENVRANLEADAFLNLYSEMIKDDE